MKQIHLGYALYNYGTHPAGWTPHSRDIATKIEHFQHYAKIAEASKFDMVFRADALFAHTDHLEAWSRNPYHMNSIEPLTLFSALSQVTSKIGLAGTISTSYSEPYNVARQLASLDHLSHGRAAWNVVTSASSDAAKNFGQSKIPSHEARYGRAREYIEAIHALWDTYEEDAFVLDPSSGYYFDPQKFHPVSYAGKYVSVDGALNIARPPQGYPVLIQAGSSGPGKQFAAEFAEVIFSLNRDKHTAQAFYKDMRDRVSAAGRDPAGLKILPSLTVVVGETKAEAESYYASLEARVPNIVKLEQLTQDLGVDVTRLPLDRPVPLELLPRNTEYIQSVFQTATELVRTGKPLREILQFYRLSGWGTPLCGSAIEISDWIEEWVADEACDGFMIIGPSEPHGLETFSASVIPELQRRGSFRREYEGNTLRDHLRLPRPKSRHSRNV
ncbi:NtaA/DmoA family FMN-dependent monooxygenase [Bradyrhizobium sp. SSUT77]|uniref:NtaA/DmoA family FMN-dependent monooxygenase n=1 Tax=Bradyrhizobium sp. SSUT77 TaxID=3040603 RepID=UPI002448F7FA|nr:NtaA/DmoA family FMN-dependent monooxygenase [Bradyrhizobium sp. SSUT77]MDH2348980.1 NtaA/DmoA family FMN-dependent monooxygenase [Bradyrhizobium sp. SSUT77]